MKSPIWSMTVFIVAVCAFAVSTCLLNRGRDARLDDHQAQIDSIKCEAQIERIERLEFQMDSLLLQYRIEVRAIQNGYIRIPAEEL